MFGKRQGREPVQQPDGSRRPHTPSGAGKLSTVIVPRSSLAKAGEPGNYALIQAVINFVNAMTRDGVYARFELTDKAMQAFHSDFYLAQVLNGGHSQFIHNCFQNLPFVVEDVRAGLTGMEARAFLPIFEQAAAWIIANPEEAKKQTGFEGGRAPFLDELDTQFYAANQDTPMIQLSSLWIKAWPELRPVDDADYVEAMNRAFLLNPLREQRLAANSLTHLVKHTLDPFLVSLGHACATAERPEIVISLGGGSIMEIEGKVQMAFYVRTNASRARYAVITKDHTTLYEHIEPIDVKPLREPSMDKLTGDQRIARERGRKSAASFHM
jgi:hypothetical protein